MQFQQPKGHKCCISTGICGKPTFGTGELSDNGYWQHPCQECEDAWNEQFAEIDDLRGTVKDLEFFLREWRSFRRDQRAFALRQTHEKLRAMCDLYGLEGK